MRRTLRRCRPVLLLLAAELVLTVFLPETGKAAFSVTGQHLLQMLSFLPPVFILLGLLDVWVDREAMVKLTGPGSGVRGVLIALALGSAAAGPLYAAFPVAAVMLNKGSSLFNVLVFLGAWSATKLPMLTFEAASMGVRFMLIRLAVDLAGILLIAWLGQKTGAKKEEQQSVPHQME